MKNMAYIWLIFFIYLGQQPAAAEDDFDLTVLATSDDVLAAVFPKDCPSGESLLNEASVGIQVNCNYQKGRYGAELKQYATDLKRLGCHVDEAMAKSLDSSFGSSSYQNNPIYKRMGNDCGFCGRKPACCGPKNAQTVLTALTKKHSELKGANPFYFESVRGVRCSANSGNACAYNPLTPEEFATLKKMQPYTKYVDTSDGCNFSQFGYTEWESARENPSFPLVETIYNKFLCRGFNTNRPRVNCIKDASKNKCMCCCHNSTPRKSGSNYICVENNESACSSV